MSDWKIHRHGEGCLVCERAFEDEERHFSILLFSEESLGRQDRCLRCFEEWDDRPEDLIFWRTRRRVQKKRGLAVDFESIERLFSALEPRSEERLRELRYLLSLMLLRKKRLKLLRGRRTDGAEFLVVRRPRHTEEILVEVFDLSPERTAALRAELERIFEGAGAEDLLVPAELSEAEGEGSSEESGGEAQGASEPSAESAPAEASSPTDC